MQAASPSPRCRRVVAALSLIACWFVRLRVLSALVLALVFGVSSVTVLPMPEAFPSSSSGSAERPVRVGAADYRPSSSSSDRHAARVLRVCAVAAGGPLLWLVGASSWSVLLTCSAANLPIRFRVPSTMIRSPGTHPQSLFTTCRTSTVRRCSISSILRMSKRTARRWLRSSPATRNASYLFPLAGAGRRFGAGRRRRPLFDTQRELGPV